MLSEHVFLADGTEKEVRPEQTTTANIALDGVPLRWTGKLIPRQKAMRMFMFKKSYQVQHVNGLTNDFLFDMAKKLPRCRCDDAYGWRTHLTNFERSDPKIREEIENYRIWCNSDNNTLLFV